MESIKIYNKKSIILSCHEYIYIIISNQIQIKYVIYIEYIVAYLPA